MKKKTRVKEAPYIREDRYRERMHEDYIKTDPPLLLGLCSLLQSMHGRATGLQAVHAGTD